MSLFYKAVLTDSQAYAIDPSIVVGSIDSTLAIAIDAFVAPTFDPNRLNSNEWTILAVDPTVMFTFEVPEMNTGYVSLAELRTKVGTQIFDSLNDKFLTINFKVSPTQGYV